MSASILSIDAVMAAMADYAKASGEEAKARDEYCDYSWDYHGASYIAAVDNARSAAESVLERYIAQVVAIELEKRGVAS